MDNNTLDAICIVAGLAFSAFIIWIQYRKSK